LPEIEIAVLSQEVIRVDIELNMTGTIGGMRNAY
jgi:hypothetical protein